MATKTVRRSRSHTQARAAVVPFPKKQQASAEQPLAPREVLEERLQNTHDAVQRVRGIVCALERSAGLSDAAEQVADIEWALSAAANLLGEIAEALESDRMLRPVRTGEAQEGAP